MYTIHTVCGMWWYICGGIYVVVYMWLYICGGIYVFVWVTTVRRTHTIKLAVVCGDKGGGGRGEIRLSFLTVVTHVISI